MPIHPTYVTPAKAGAAGDWGVVLMTLAAPAFAGATGVA